MASVSRDTNGTKRVLFTDGDGERRAVRLGRALVKAAESFRLRVEALLSAKELHHSPDPELSAWLRDLPERMYARLARVGLVESRTKAEVVTLGMLLDRFDAAAAVKASDQSPYAIAKGAGVARSQLSRMMRGESGMTADTIERLAEYLGLEVVIRPKLKRRARP